MEKSVESGAELYQLLHNLTQKHFKPEAAAKGVMVTSKVRAEVLTSTEQGRITSRGCVMDIKFENMQGGVWRAYVDYFYNRENKIET